MRDGVTSEFALVPREKAVVSVFDSAFLLGDGCWEGIRMKQGVMQFAKVRATPQTKPGSACAQAHRARLDTLPPVRHARTWSGLLTPTLQEHLDRLFETSKALFMNLHLNKPELLSLIHQTVDANSMQTSDDVHIRLIVSRGLKETPHQNPKSTIGVRS